MNRFLVYLSFALAEVLPCCFVIKYFLPSEKKLSFYLKCVLVWAGAYVLLLYAYQSSSCHYWHYAIFRLLLVGLFVFILTQKKWEEVFFATLLIEGGTRFWEHAIGDLSKLSKNNGLRELFYLSECYSVRVLFFEVLIFLFYTGSLLLFFSLAVKKNTVQVLRRSSLFLLIVYCMLVLSSDLTIRLMMTGKITSLQLISLMVFELMWYLIFLISMLCFFSLEHYYMQRQENLTLQTTIQLQAKQFQLRKEELERLARISHDMKKHLDTLHQIENEKERSLYASQLRRELTMFDISCDTGNETLNVLLRDRLLLCRRYEIPLLLLVDGKKLDFLQMADLVALFGNALDNAIEAVRRLDPPSKREISVHMSVTRGWLVLCFQNRYVHTLVLDNGMPRTTKPDRELHGYGLGSIEMVCQKYGGEMTIDTADGKFVLTVALPVQQL